MTRASLGREASGPPTSTCRPDHLTIAHGYLAAFSTVAGVHPASEAEVLQGAAH